MASKFVHATTDKLQLTSSQYNYGQPRAGNMALSEYVTKQGKNFRVTHTSDIVPRLPWKSVAILALDKDIYGHISPEYWITDGLGNNPKNYKILEGNQNYDGNAANSWGKFNIVAHIQYYQTNMVSNGRRNI